MKTRIKELREKTGLTMKEMSAQMNLPYTTYINYEKGYHGLTPETLNMFANHFGVTVDYLLCRTSDPHSSTKRATRIPVFGNVAAGIPIEAIEEVLDFEEIDAHTASRGEYFGLKIHGASMEPRMTDGDVVIVRVQPDVENGEIAIVRINGSDAVCKKVSKTAEGIILSSTNPAYPPSFFTKEQIINEPVEILGKVVELRAKM